MLPAGAKIYVATVPVDMRRGFDGLAASAREHIGLDPREGALFLFFNRRVDRVKALWWDRNGYCLLYKRLERERFYVPQPLHVGGTSVQIDVAELERIFRGGAIVRRKIA